ncbi:kinase-like domain-containing protein, partial [Baffinella frigidus]
VALLNEKMIGNGSFGVVFQATVAETGELVAIKKVLQDKRFKNRELDIMKRLRHINVVELKRYFYTNGDKPGEVFLNLMLEFVPETLYRVIKLYSRAPRPIPSIQAKVYMYQVLRALAYVHSMGVCHRDIKPQNLLLDPNSHVVKLCDFGSAKLLVPGESNIAYICSRYYRAPELIFGATDYSTAIDTWCRPHRPSPGPGKGGSGIKCLAIPGPTRQKSQPALTRRTCGSFPQMQQYSWSKVFRARAPPEMVDLIAQLLVYVPAHRILPMHACAHVCFDELRNPAATLPDGRPLPTSYAPLLK